MVAKVTEQWDELKNKLEDKVKFIKQKHKKHHAEINEYSKLEELFDQSKFMNKVDKSISMLQDE